MSHTMISVVINPIVVRIAVDCGVVVSAEIARVREVLVRRMGYTPVHERAIARRQHIALVW
jgi:hypothetical protein